MRKADFKRWLNKKWIEGRFSEDEVKIITEHSILNVSKNIHKRDEKGKFIKGGNIRTCALRGCDMPVERANALYCCESHRV